MRPDYGKMGISAGVGLIDYFAQESDVRAGRAEAFRNMADIGRLIGTGVGLAMQVFSRAPGTARWGEQIANTSAAFLVQSIVVPVKGMIARGQPSRSYVPRRTATPTPTTSASGRFNRSAQPEFEQATVW